MNDNQKRFMTNLVDDLTAHIKKHNQNDDITADQFIEQCTIFLSDRWYNCFQETIPKFHLEAIIESIKINSHLSFINAPDDVRRGFNELIARKYICVLNKAENEKLKGERDELLAALKAAHDDPVWKKLEALAHDVLNLDDKVNAAAIGEPDGEKLRGNMGVIKRGETMTYEVAKSVCHVRSAIFRKSKGIRYWKNHHIPFDDRVPAEDQKADDWLEYDPRDEDFCSLFMFND